MTVSELMKDLTGLPPDREIGFAYDAKGEEIYTEIGGTYNGLVSYSMKSESDIVLISADYISSEDISEAIILRSF